jgi:adenine-specific DNA-methyltransferase
LSKVDDAIAILHALGLPRAQQNERSALTLLALAQVGPRTDWSQVRRPLLRIVDIMDFMRRKYKKNYAPNTRETIRGQTIHQFEQARIVDRNPDDPVRPTNSGKNAYQLTPHAAAVVAVFKNSAEFDAAVQGFQAKFGSLRKKYAGARNSLRVPLKLPGGKTIQLSPGGHNELQAAIIEEFGPRFAAGAEVLYVGDTAMKHVVLESERLATLNVQVTEHDKLPDIILYRRDVNWLYLIEAVTSHGPVTPKRYIELEHMFANCTADRVYVTAFPSAAKFRRYAADVAWETEVWLRDNPDHMIHFNGPKFMGPYKIKKRK